MCDKLHTPLRGIMRHKHYILQFLAYQKAGNLEGSMMEFYAGLEYRLFKPFALGAAYDRLVISAESAASNGFRADVNWNLLYLYGTLYLF